MRRVRVSWIALGLGLAPFLVGAVVLAAAAGDLHPIQDVAQMEMRVRDVGRYRVLLGPFSRDGWFHPGPAVFYLLAVPYRLTGGSSAGLYLGALAINAGSVAGMAMIARRRGGTALMLVTLLAAGLLVRSLGADFVRDPWNPSVTVLPFGLMLFLAWAMSCRELWALPVGAAVASFLAQTHIGYAALALPLLAWGAAWIVAPVVASSRFWRRASVARHRYAPPEASRKDVRTVAASVGLLVIFWAPTVVEQLTGDPGNLGEVVEYFRSSDEPAHSLTDGWRVLSTQLGVTPDWITGLESTSLSGEPVALYGGLIVPVLLVPLGLAAVFLWRRGGDDSRRLLLTLAVALGMGLLAVARTTGIAFTYRLHWVQVLGMATGVVMAWAAWLAIRPHLRPGWSRPVTAGAVAALAVVATVDVVAAARAGIPLERESGAVAALGPGVLAGLPQDSTPPEGDGGEDPVVRVDPTSFGSLLYTTGIVLELERSGVDARMAGDTEAAGAHRDLGDDRPTTTLVVAVDEDIAGYLADPEVELLASWGTPPEPRGDDDPVAAAEAAFAANDTRAMKELGRRHLDDDLPEPFDIVAVAVFLQR